MAIDGAVSATKALRDKSQPLHARVDLARQIMDGELQVILPRKYSVLLEWVLDTLAIDPQAKSEASIWASLSTLWPLVDGETQQRLYKNHKFVVNLTAALQAGPENLVVLATATQIVASTVHLFSLVADFQISQLVLAYLGAQKVAGLTPAYRQLGQIIFEGTRSRTLFSKRTTDDLLLILREPDADHKRHYLVDFFRSNPGLDADKLNTDMTDADLLAMIDALCESQTNVADRIVALVHAIPAKAAFVLRSVAPQFLTADMLRQTLQYLFGHQISWDVVRLCLEVSPAAVLGEPSQISKIAEAGPDSVVALLLLKLAQQRQLFEFLEAWSPQREHGSEVTTALAGALGMLAPVQIVNLLEAKPPALALIIDSMTYHTTHDPRVRHALVQATADSPHMQLRASELVPDFPLEKSKAPELRLRRIELQQPDAQKIHISADKDALVLRFFPALSQSLDGSKLEKLVGECSMSTRQALACSLAALENETVIHAVLEVAIRQQELAVLGAVPKSVFSWDQRHRAVATVINAFDFSEAGELVATLIDFQHLPNPGDLAQFAKSALPSQAGRLLDLVKIVQKDAQYIKRFREGLLDWEQVLLSCYLEPETAGAAAIDWMREQDIGQLSEPIVLSLSLLPAAESRELTAEVALQLITTPEFSAELFGLLASHSYSWPLMAAVFIASGHRFEHEFGLFCGRLTESEQRAMIVMAVVEKEYELLQTLAQHHFFGRDCHKAITYAVVEGVTRGEDTLAFWEFVDAVLRDPQPLLSQYALESVLMKSAAAAGQHWDLSVRVLSRLLLFKRPAFRNRFHLVVEALTAALQSVQTPHEADGFTRLVDNFVNPTQIMSKQRADNWLTSQVARERRRVAQVAGVLLQNIVLVVLARAGEIAEWSAVSQALRPAAFLLVDLVHNDGLRVVSAGMDNASRAYLRKIFDDYKLFERWTSD